MKGKDFFRIAVFLIIFLLINSFFSNLFVKWSRKSTEYSIIHKEFSTIQDQVSVIILGDSHPQKSVMASEIPGAYNLSSSGEDYPYTYYIMKHYLEGGDFNPELAVIQIGPHNFLASSKDIVNAPDPAYWDDYVNLLEIGYEADSVIEMVPTIFLAKFPLVGGLNNVKQKIWPTVDLSPEPLIKGYVPEYEDMSDYSDDRMEKLGRHRAATLLSNGEYMNDVMVEYFLRLLDLLESYDVKVVLVWYPTTRNYYENAAYFIPIESHLDNVEDLLGERQPDLILDYHDLFFDHPEFLADSDHLNVRGAKIVTNLLVDELKDHGLLSDPSEDD